MTPRAATLTAMLLGCSPQSASEPEVFADHPTTATPDAVNPDGADASVDTRQILFEAGVDSALDSALDARGDSAPDARGDSAPDARGDSALDARGDSALDARGDSADAPVDSPTDTVASDRAATCSADTSTDSLNCGACGHVCATPANARPFCAVGVCTWACNANFGDCDGRPTNGCESSLHSLAHCGACGASCEIDNGVGACSMTTCTVVSCMAGFADCDRMAANGCEADLQFNRLHCAVCGHVCAKACVDGACSS